MKAIFMLPIRWHFLVMEKGKSMDIWKRRERKQIDDSISNQEKHFQNNIGRIPLHQGSINRQADGTKLSTASEETLDHIQTNIHSNMSEAYQGISRLQSGENDDGLEAIAKRLEKQRFAEITEYQNRLKVNKEKCTSLEQSLAETESEIEKLKGRLAENSAKETDVLQKEIDRKQAILRDYQAALEKEQEVSACLRNEERRVRKRATLLDDTQRMTSLLTTIQEIDENVILRGAKEEQYLFLVKLAQMDDFLHKSRMSKQSEQRNEWAGDVKDVREECKEMLAAYANVPEVMAERYMPTESTLIQKDGGKEEAAAKKEKEKQWKKARERVIAEIPESVSPEDKEMIKHFLRKL